MKGDELSVSVDVTFDGRGLVPAVLQHAETGEVLMVAWMNREAVRLTKETGQAHFWSRSRRTLWHKGETSGNVMHVREMWIDCDGDTLLVRVDPAGPACHTGERSCFYRRLGLGSDDVLPTPDDGAGSFHSVGHQKGGVQRPGGGRGGAAHPESSPAARTRAHRVAAAPAEGRGILAELFDVILDRRERRPSDSYTTALFQAGEDEILKKVGEEAMEVVLAAKGEGDERVVSEVADLVYHLLVLLASRDLAPADVEAELWKRRR